MQLVSSCSFVPVVLLQCTPESAPPPTPPPPPLNSSMQSRLAMGARQLRIQHARVIAYRCRYLARFAPYTRHEGSAETRHRRAERDQSRAAMVDRRFRPRITGHPQPPTGPPSSFTSVNISRQPRSTRDERVFPSFPQVSFQFLTPREFDLDVASTGSRGFRIRPDCRREQFR